MAARRPQPPPPPPPPPPPQPQQKPRPRGMLAFLSATGEHYPHLDDYWKKKEQPSGTDGGGARFETSSRTTRKRRRSRRPPPGSPETVEDGPARETVALVDWFHSADINEEGSEEALASEKGTLDASKDAGAKGSAPERLLASRQGGNPTTILVLFCFDPDQPHSAAVRNRILGLFDGLALRQRSDKAPLLRLRCVAISSAHRTSPGGAAAVDEFLRHTGFVAIPWSSQMASTAILPPHTPALAVYRDRKKISRPHEELGLEWNSVDDVLDRWGRGQSALSCSQQALAGAVFPASCTVL